MDLQAKLFKLGMNALMRPSDNLKTTPIKSKEKDQKAKSASSSSSRLPRSISQKMEALKPGKMVRSAIGSIKNII